MLAIFESILPVFLLIVAGNLLRRTTVINQAAWPGLEQLGYWFLYPTLLFTTILKADFSGLAIDAIMSALMISVLAICAFTYALYPLLIRSGLVGHAQYSSVFQTSVRWNAFIALAVAQKIFPPEAMAVVALAMAVIILPINLSSVYVVMRFADRQSSWVGVLRNILINPLILSCLAGIVMRFMPFGLYEPLDEALNLVGRAALGMGLIAVGSGLRPEDLIRSDYALLVPVVIKLVLFPLLTMAVAMAFGVTGIELGYLVLCASVPTAMNGYLLARQLGGDAPLYAAVVTLADRRLLLHHPGDAGAGSVRRRIERVDDQPRIVARVEHAVGCAPLAGEPRLDEGVGDAPGPHALQFRGRRRQRQLLGQDARRALVGRGHLHGRAQHGDGARTALPQIPLDAGQHLVEQRRRPFQHPQHVERHDIARAFPDRVDRRFAVIARQRRFLDIAVAAKALHRLVEQRRRDLADPVFHHRRHGAGKRRLATVARRLVEGARQAEGKRRRAGHVQRHVGQHPLHQRLVDQLLAEDLAMPWCGAPLRPARRASGPTTPPRSRAASASPCP